MEVSNRTVKSIKDSLREYEHDTATLRSVLESEKAHKARKTAVAAIEEAIENADETPQTMSETPEIDEIEDSCKVLANAFHTAKYADKAGLDGSPEDVVAVALIRKLSLGADGYTMAFGKCGVSDCERGCNGFTADTCDQHDKSDIGGSGSSSGDGDTMTVTIDGKEVSGDKETIKALLDQ